MKKPKSKNFHFLLNIKLNSRFLYKNNPNDVVWIKLGLNETDELLGDKKQLLEKLDISISTEVNLLPGPTFISPELLGFVRVFNMNKGFY